MKYVLLFFFTLFLVPKTIAQSKLDSLLVLLEKTMENRSQYDEEKKAHIERLSNLLKDKSLTLEQNYHIVNDIIKDYVTYSFDSTLFYIEKNVVTSKLLQNSYFEDETQLNLSNLLASTGRYKEAIDILNEIDRGKLSKNLLGKYYYNFKESYLGLSFYTLVKRNKQKYSELYGAYKDSLKAELAMNSIEYLGVVESNFLDKRQLMESLKINSRRLSMTHSGTREYSLITFERSLIYELEKNREEQKRYLILSAISDIQASVKDNASLSTLALLLFEENDIDRAHKYINFSFEDANFYNSRLRFILISNILPIITKAYEERSEKQKGQLQYLLIGISFLGLVLLFTVFHIFRQMKKLAKARNELVDANKKLSQLNNTLKNTNKKLEKLHDDLSESSLVKEHYIGTFLSIQSNYIDKLDSYRKMVKKHIIAKKVNDLFERTKSNQIIEDELKLFYKNFDDTFLHIFPNFVEKLNKLLNEEGKIILKNKEQLNTELRIFALIRLGINESSKIAKLLRYSVNTIYNYRVKIKNFAIVPRDEFENEVMKIGASKK